MTERYELIETELMKTNILYRDFDLLSELSQSRVKDVARIPSQLEKGNIKLAGIKKYFPLTEEIDELMAEQFPILQQYKHACYFVEAQDKLLTNKTFKQEETGLHDLNEELLAVDHQKKLKIGLVYLGKQAPVANNVVDGLIRFAEKRGNVELIGFINGVEGLMKGEHVSMTKESFKNYVNLGGIDYIGRGPDELRTSEQK